MSVAVTDSKVLDRRVAILEVVDTELEFSTWASLRVLILDKISDADPDSVEVVPKFPILLSESVAKSDSEHKLFALLLFEQESLELPDSEIEEDKVAILEELSVEEVDSAIVDGKAAIFDSESDAVIDSELVAEIVKV